MEIISKNMWRRSKATRLTSTSFILPILIIFLNTVNYGSCRRLSFKESLTSFTESPNNVLDSDLADSHQKTVSHPRDNPPEKIPRLKMHRHPFIAEALPPSVNHVDKIIMIELEHGNQKPSQSPTKQSVKCRFPFACPSSSEKLKTAPASAPAQTTARVQSIRPTPSPSSGFGSALIQKGLDDSKSKGIPKTQSELEPQHHHNHPELKPNFSSFSQKLVENGFRSSSSADTHPRKGPLSLWELTKNIFFQFQNSNKKSKHQAGTGATFHSIPIPILPEKPLSLPKIKDVKDNENSIGFRNPMNSPDDEAQPEISQNFLKNTRNLLHTIKTELDRFVTKNGTQFPTEKHSTNFSKTILHHMPQPPVNLRPQKSLFLNMKSKSDGEPKQSERAKKNVLSTFGWGWTPASGLSNLALSTAKALWSVNKEHFLPTFLHTKTGGKLSLIRDSIFKPVTILSQFKSGVAQIQHEKSHNLARHHHGWGWSSGSHPVTAQSDHLRLFTIAKYIYKLTRHTVVTKWRLKRALLDLQLRAVRKLLRIVSNKSFGQKLATVKILLNAGLQAKQGFFHALRAAVQTTTTEQPMPMKPYGPYPGSDHSQNVDLTYSAPAPAPPMNHYGPPMPSMPTPPNSYQRPPPSDSYQSPPLSNPYQGAPLSDNYQGPPPSLQQPPSDYGKFQQSYNAPSPMKMSSKRSRFPSTLFAPPSPANPLGISEHLIEAPSYASLLHTMGINPSNYQALQTPPTSTSASNIVTFTTNRAPSPFSFPTMSPSSTKSTFFNQPSSSSTTSYPKSSFRLKLLEQMSVDTLGMS